jgi:hypothetical protein
MPSRNLNPYRIQYIDAQGIRRVSEPIYGSIHGVEVWASQLVAAGNVIEVTYRDRVGGLRTPGAGNQIAPPCWTGRLGGRP